MWSFIIMLEKRSLISVRIGTLYFKVCEVQRIYNKQQAIYWNEEQTQKKKLVHESTFSSNHGM